MPVLRRNCNDRSGSFALDMIVRIQRGMSASPRKRTNSRPCWYVRLVPLADSCTATYDSRCVGYEDLLDHLVGARKQRRRHLDAERLRSLEVDHELRLLNALEVGPDPVPRQKVAKRRRAASSGVQTPTRSAMARASSTAAIRYLE
jgi:hypothetical protein